MNTSDVVNRLTYHRRRQGPLIDYLRTEDVDLADKVNGCGSWLHIREWYSGESRLRNANFCKRFTLCGSCAARRASKMVAAYEGKVLSVIQERADLIPVMITLTVRNGPDLPERMRHLKDSWKRMGLATRKGKSESGRHHAIEWNKVLGGVRAIEITRNSQTGEWHPHMHIFALVTDYIEVHRLSGEWERFTGDSKIVDVRKCKNGIVPGLIECLKYVSKLSDLTPPQTLEVHRAAKGSRFTDALGILRGVPEPEIDQDDCTGLEGPYRDYMLHWLGQSYMMQAISKKLEILRPGDAGYDEPRELVPVENPNSATMPDLFCGQASTQTPDDSEKPADPRVQLTTPALAG